MNFLEKIMFVFVSLVIIFCCYFTFIWIPFFMVAESKCLERGYPATSLTYDLKVYCKNISGDVNSVVIRLD